MSAGVWPAGRKWCTNQILKDIDLKFCEAADIYVDVHILIRFSIYAKSSSLGSIL